MFGRLIRSFSKGPLICLLFGCVLLGTLIKEGDFPQLLLPAKDYDYVLENGLKNGQHVKGEISYCLGSFAAKETYTQYENSRTAGKTTGYYYMIPVGEGGLAAIYVRDADVDAMERLSEETYAYMSGGEEPKTRVHFEGVSVKMERNLKGLEGAFRDDLKDLEYTDSEIEEMLKNYTAGECLVLQGPAAMSTFYVMAAISIVLILLGILLVVRNFRKGY